MRTGRRLFPVGLYTTLLAGAALLVAPGTFQPVEDVLRAAITLPLRAWTNARAPAAAGPADADDGLRAGLVAELLRREERAATRGGPAHGGDVPVPCRVVGAQAWTSATLRHPTVLLLDRPASALPGARAWVTHGDALVGTLVEGEKDGPARVVLLQHRAPHGPPRRVPALAELGGDDVLRFLVEPAGTLDPWPLRCTLPSDPYRVARPLAARAPVVTECLPNDPFGALPAGLQIGTLELWGYARHNVVIGLFVRPARDLRLLASVAVWCERPGGADALPDPLALGACHPVLRTTLGAGRRERWFLACSGFVPPVGAAVLRGHALVGVVEAAGPGHALAAPLGIRGPASFLLLPDGGGAPIACEGALRRLRSELLLDVAPGTWPAGVLFSGAGAPSCPAGLVIGRVAAVAGASGLLRVEPVTRDAGAGVSVFVARPAP